MHDIADLKAPFSLTIYIQPVWPLDTYSHAFQNQSRHYSSQSTKNFKMQLIALIALALAAATTALDVYFWCPGGTVGECCLRADASAGIAVGCMFPFCIPFHLLLDEGTFDVVPWEISLISRYVGIEATPLHIGVDPPPKFEWACLNNVDRFPECCKPVVSTVQSS